MRKELKQQPYTLDIEAKEKIDMIFSQCATIFANLGMNNKHDLITRSAAKAAERKLLDKIKDIDKTFFDAYLYDPYSETKKENPAE